ncbi:unnamed protein product [Gongylonema pulchrum]|uniref:Uncharacterized protein n=1 Tax=Gongylonema pulchrum TaxID=637853 RepID=A0A3P7NPU1_9BILA|nr:unnamed protein product [Gongylonema pulchrum]
MGNELCQIAIRIAQFFEQQKQQILITTPAPQSTASPTPTPTHLLQFGAPRHRLPESKPTTANENAFYEASDEEQEDNGDLAAKFAADLCADDRVDVPVPVTGDPVFLRTKRELYFQTTAKTQRFNPLIKEGLWAPDLTLMLAPKFSAEVALSKKFNPVLIHHYFIALL